MNKDPYVVPEQAHLIILDIMLSICIAKNGKDTKHIIRISRRNKILRNGKECNFYKKLWCEVGMQLADIGTKNFREY